MESDRDKLIRLATIIQKDPAFRAGVHELVEQVGKCQNSCTCDGTVDKETWDEAKAISKAATNMLDHQHALLLIQAKRTLSDG